MRPLYCRRCRCEMPMLDEDEFAVVAEAWAEAFDSSRWRGDRPEGAGVMDQRFAPVLDAYERMTGFRETHAAAVMHHRLSLYGPPCAACARPLRTAKAAHCAACGTPRA